MTDNGFITVREARDIMGVSDGKMSTILKKGEIPHITSEWDRRVKLVKRADVEAWMQRAGPRPPRRHEAKPNGGVVGNMAALAIG